MKNTVTVSLLYLVHIFKFFHEILCIAKYIYISIFICFFELHVWIRVLEKYHRFLPKKACNKTENMRWIGVIPILTMYKLRYMRYEMFAWHSWYWLWQYIQLSMYKLLVSAICSCSICSMRCSALNFCFQTFYWWFRLDFHFFIFSILYALLWSLVFCI